LDTAETERQNATGKGTLMSRKLRMMATVIGFLWVIEVVNMILDHRLCRFGIVPRSVHGLIGIPLSPLLHASLQHLLANTVAFAILGGLVLLRSRRDFVESTVFITILGGLGVWAFGRPAVHVGASGLVFGYFGFLVGRAWYERKLRSLIPAVLAIVLYGGIIWGVLPTQPGVSWEGHLCGLLAGWAGAKLAAKPPVRHTS